MPTTKTNLPPEVAKREAEALQKNALLPDLLELYRREIYDQWQAATTVQERERMHVLNAAVTSIEDLIRAKCSELSTGGDASEQTTTGVGDGASGVETQERTDDGRTWGIGREP
jgi:hypothetical protein